ncbi:fam-c protein [Plasmodium vinckei brucechwatti]|uniref:Fam-c protein n=1 Tax=Plasmodium vinckei brucechwatti TaxID=119398 RepID=A0A6V7S2W0_PLAVN|nr:fam-c protein [Plasmodium vinckei brucechwatti]
MNKRIYSLVCIALYALLDASIYCSQQKESDARNKSVRGTKEINRSNEKNDIEFKQGIQLKNNNPKNNEDDKDDLDDKDYKDETYDSEYTNEDDIYNRKYVNNDKIYNRKCVNNDDVDYGENDKESSGFNISKRTKENLYSKVPSDLSSDEMIKIFLNNHKDLPTNKLEFTEYILNIFEKDPEQTAFLFKLYSKLSKKELYDDYYYMMSNFSGRMKNALWLSIKFQFLILDTLYE